MKYIGRTVMTSPIIGDITYTHNQSSTSDTWSITNSANQLTITFFSGGSALAFQGKAYLN